MHTESVVVTGAKNILHDKKYKIYEVQPDKKNIDLSIKNALFFNLKYFLKTQKLLSCEKFDLIHHVLPFSINNTFDLSFIFSNKKTPLVIGPIQCPLEFSDSDINIFNIRSSIKKFKFTEYLYIYLNYIFKPLLKILSNLTLKKSSAVVVINELAKSVLVKNGINPSKIHVISPGINSKQYQQNKFELKSNNKIQLLVVSYLLKRKAVDLVIMAIKEVIKNNENIVLRIVGDGPQKRELEDLVNKLELQNYIIFEGFVNNNEIQKYYKNAHIFLSMSRDESWGQMYLEAMASGLPIIATKNNGASGIIKDNVFGYLIEKDDYIAFSRKILTMINDFRIINEFGKNAREEVKNKYDWDDCIIPKYLAIYSGLINKN